MGPAAATPPGARSLGTADAASGGSGHSSPLVDGSSVFEGSWWGTPSPTARASGRRAGARRGDGGRASSSSPVMPPSFNSAALANAYDRSEAPRGGVAAAFASVHASSAAGPASDAGARASTHAAEAAPPAQTSHAAAAEQGGGRAGTDPTEDAGAPGSTVSHSNVSAGTSPYPRMDALAEPELDSEADFAPEDALASGASSFAEVAGGAFARARWQEQRQPQQEPQEHGGQKQGEDLHEANGCHNQDQQQKGRRADEPGEQCQDEFEGRRQERWGRREGEEEGASGEGVLGVEGQAPDEAGAGAGVSMASSTLVALAGVDKLREQLREALAAAAVADERAVSAGERAAAAESELQGRVLELRVANERVEAGAALADALRATAAASERAANAAEAEVEAARVRTVAAEDLGRGLLARLEAAEDKAALAQTDAAAAREELRMRERADAQGGKGAVSYAGAAVPRAELERAEAALAEALARAEAAEATGAATQAELERALARLKTMDSLSERHRADADESFRKVIAAESAADAAADVAARAEASEAAAKEAAAAAAAEADSLRSELEASRTQIAAILAQADAESPSGAAALVASAASAAAARAEASAVAAKGQGISRVGNGRGPAGANVRGA